MLKTQTLIDKHFNTLLEPLTLSTEEQIQAVLSDETKMEALLDHLRTINEISDDALTPVRAHYNLGDEIKKAEENKKQAAIDEEFELAAMYKKKILQLKEEAMTVEKLRNEYLNKEPTLRINQLFEEMNKLDPTYTKSFIESNLSQLQGPITAGKKVKAVNQLLVLQQMFGEEEGLESVKTSFEETLQVIHKQVRATEHAQKTMAYEMDELSEEEVEQFKSHKKVKVFLTGIQAMLVVLSMQISTLETAEQLDSQFQIDFEAILNEARQLKQNLMGLKDQVDRLLGFENLDLICNEVDLTQDGILTSEDAEDTETEISINTLLSNIAKGKENTQQVQCQLCCQRLSLGEPLTQKLPSMKSVVQNGKKYHAVCINLWLLRSKSAL